VADEGVLVDCLAERCHESRSWDIVEIQQEIDRLIERGLIIVLDGKALSIALRAPVPRLYSRPSPMGSVSIPTAERER
jgi:hypothetical protein